MSGLVSDVLKSEEKEKLIKVGTSSLSSSNGRLDLKYKEMTCPKALTPLSVRPHLVYLHDNLSCISFTFNTASNKCFSIELSVCPIDR